MKFRLILGAIVSLLSFQGLYALKFDQTTMLVKAEGGETVLHAQFKFINDGDKPVKIVSVRPSCGCTTATLDKKIFGPKEEGTIKAALSVGDREGFQSKTIAVTTDEGNGVAYLLTFNADIPELFTIEPRLLFWQYRGPLETQAIFVQYAHGQAVKLLTVKGQDRLFRTTIQPLRDHSGVKVLVTPESTQKSAQCQMALIFEVDGKRKISRNVFLKILPDPSSVDPLAQTPRKQTRNP